MFTNENHEDDSSLSVNLTSNNQIHEITVYVLRYTQENCCLPICHHSVARYHNLADLYDDLADRYHNNVHSINIPAQLICDLILPRLPTSVHSQFTMLGAFAARSSQVDYGEKKRIEEFCRNYRSSSALYYYTTICHPSADRYDDLVDRYHNNVHFLVAGQLVRDLILFRLPTSVHSQSTMLGAFAARSSQIDYGEKKQIEDFCRSYQSSSALDDYTKDSFFYRVLNHALRQQQYDIIYQYRHAMIDVIKCLRKISPFRDKTGSSILHRGQQMTIFELEKMKNNVGELFSCSSFFSTSSDPRIAEIFAGDGSDDNPYLVSVIFQIRLDASQPMRPYARIENSGEEEEMLFSPGTRFCLMSCRKLHDNGRLWLFELVAISEKQQEQLILNHGETFLLLSSARGWPISVVVVHHIIT